MTAGECGCATPFDNDCTYDLIGNKTGCVCSCHQEDAMPADNNTDDVTVVQINLDQNDLRKMIYSLSNETGYGDVLDVIDRLAYAMDLAQGGPLMLEVKPLEDRQAMLTRYAMALANSPGEGNDTEKARALLLAAAIEHTSEMEGDLYTLPEDDGSTTSELDCVISWVTHVVAENR